MVDPRIYRAGLALVAVAVIIFGFSLQDPPTPDTTTLAPPVTGGPTPAAVLQSLVQRFPKRAPGSPADNALAGYVAAQLRQDSFSVSRDTFAAATARGNRLITTVTGSRLGLTGGTIVVVAHRDAAGSPALADLSGTTVLLGLAHALAGETLNHSLILVSTSGSAGAAGTDALVQTLAGQPVDAVIVLGDLAAAHPSRPLIDPWSDSALRAPPVLSQTLGTYVQSLTGLSVGSTSFGGQLAHLAFPLTLGEQGPLGRAGVPAVLLSLSGTRPPAPSEAINVATAGELQGALIQTVSALDAAPGVPAPQAFLTLGGKLVPPWAVRLLALALIVPVGLATVDALARLRRRGHSVLHRLGWVLGTTSPFLLVLVELLVVRLAGLLPAAPPGPTAEGAVAIGTAGIAVMVVGVLLLVVGFWLVRPLVLRAADGLAPGVRRSPQDQGDDAVAVAIVLVLLALTIASWVFDPFTSLLFIPALHLWLWLAGTDRRPRRAVAPVLAIAGAAPVALVCLYYAHAFGLSPLGIAWLGVLLVAGGQITSLTGLGWSLYAGCLTGVLILGVRTMRRRDVAPSKPVSVRGPVTYAGPGSLGGTESAIGSRR